MLNIQNTTKVDTEISYKSNELIKEDAELHKFKKYRHLS